MHNICRLRYVRDRHTSACCSQRFHFALARMTPGLLGVITNRFIEIIFDRLRHVALDSCCDVCSLRELTRAQGLLCTASLQHEPVSGLFLTSLLSLSLFCSLLFLPCSALHTWCTCLEPRVHAAGQRPPVDAGLPV